MPRPEITDRAHTRVKQYAAKMQITIEQAYDQIICDYLDEWGKPKTQRLNP